MFTKNIDKFFPKTINLKIVLFWLFTAVLIFFLYRQSFQLYFFQDDFFLFKISEVKDIKSILGFFAARNDVIFYRPLSMQLFYFLGNIFFKTNPFFYHIFGFSLHILNVYLVYSLINKISKIKILAFLTAFVYGTSGIHFMALSWIAAFHFFFGTLFFLISFIFFIKYLEESNIRSVIFSLLMFVLALLSDELVICLPMILIFYYLFSKNIKINLLFKNIIIFLPFLTLVILYIFYRSIIVPINFNDTYHPYFDLRAIKNLWWYVLWLFNLPEEFKYQMISFFKINPKFIQDFYQVNMRAWWLLIINVFFIYFIPLGIMLFGKSYVKKRQLFFKTSFLGLGWFLVCLLPVIFLPLHQYPYFLTIAGIGFYLFLLSPLAYVITYCRAKKYSLLIFMLISLSLWYTASLTNVQFMGTIHWIIPRAKFSQIYINRIKSQFPQLPSGSTIVITKMIEKQTLIHALMDSDAAYFIYRDSSIKLAYDDFSIPDNCADIMNRKKLSDPELWGVINVLFNQCLTENNIFFLDK